MSLKDLNESPFSYRGLIGHGIWMVGEEVSRGTRNLAPAILHLYHLAYPVICDDERFQEEWRALHDMEDTDPIRIPDDPAGGKGKRFISRMTRFEEYGLIVASLYRMGVVAPRDVPIARDDAIARLLGRQADAFA